MPNYIDKNEFHDELVMCKRKGELSSKAIGFFQLMANEISKTYYYNQPEDRHDAKARAVQDCYRYWRGFKESNVVQIKFDENFTEKDKVTIDIIGYKTLIFVASMNPKKPNEFQIRDSINRSLKSLIACINGTHNEIAEGFLDTIKKKLTIMDKFNGEDLNVKSKLQVVQIIGGEMKTSEYEFKNPPNAFCYITSCVRNGILKVFNELYPDVHKPANRISLTSLNDHQQRFCNI